MSKKIIAIALFAVMLLSLVPVANGAALATITGFQVNSLKYSGQTGTDEAPAATDFYADNATAADASKYEAFALTGTKVGSIDRTGGLVYGGAKTDSTATISGKYGDLLKVKPGKFDTDRAPMYQYVITLDTAEYKTVTVNGATADVVSSKITGYFQAKQGGNTQDITVVLKNDDTTTTKTFSLTYKDTESSIKTVKGLTFDVKSTPVVTGDYRAYVQQGVLCIDYAADLDTATARNVIGFEFYSDSVRVPASGQNAVYHADTTATTTLLRTDDKLLLSGSAKEARNDLDDAAYGNAKNDPAVVGTSVTTILNDETSKVGFAINPSVSSFKIKIEDKNYFYQSESVKVQWRAVPRNEITAATITERNVTLALGETKKLDITPAQATSYAVSDMRLVDVGYQSIVYIDGMSIKALKVGTTNLKLEVRGYVNGVETWKTIDMITVTVKDAAAIVVPGTQYRVIARSLNVRSGAGTSFAKAGTVSQNTVLDVTEIANGWAKLSNGTYVSAQYLVAVTGATGTGNYTVTASSLNARSAANGAIVGKLTKGTAVTVTSIVGGWAQLSNGTWVSALYIK